MKTNKFILLFSYVMLINAMILPVFLIYSFFAPVKVTMYGFTSNTVFSITGLLIVIMWLSKAVIGYGFIKQKTWAIKAGLIDAVFSIVIYIISTVEPFIYYNPKETRSISGVILFLIPYLIIMYRMNEKKSDRFNSLQSHSL